MDFAKGFKGFRIEENELFMIKWEVKLVGSKKQDDKHLAVFYDKESLDLFTELLKNNGIKNLTNIKLY